MVEPRTKTILRRLRTLGDPLLWWVYGVAMIAVFLLYEFDRIITR